MMFALGIICIILLGIAGLLAFAHLWDNVESFVDFLIAFSIWAFFLVPPIVYISMTLGS